MDTQCKGHCRETGVSSNSLGGLYRLETQPINVYSGSTYFIFRRNQVHTLALRPA